MSIGRRLRGERGAELIEFAIVAPLLILLLAGIFDFGMMFRAYEAVTNAAREGARVGVLEGYSDADVQARVTAYMTSAGLTGHNTQVGTQAVTTGAGTFTARAVTVNYQYQFASLGVIGAMFGGSFTSIPLRAAAVMRIEAAAAPPGP